MGQSENMEQADNRPKWLLELENRKRKPRLAHEVGAGAPCMTCSTDCPGLDLHFWRKICKNCKCSRDDHDVPNDEFPQFDLLFGLCGKPNRRNVVLKVNQKQSDAEVTFEWAPPDTTKELAADYMKALPEDKLPIKGSAGAALRKQQLQRQLPLHDIDHKVCDELSESERKQFEKYLENLKKYVGQGKVMKAVGARPFDRSLMTPVNATDMNRFSPKHKQSQLETVHSLHLRTPSSFVPKSTFPTSHAPSELTNGLANRSTDLPNRDQSPSSAARMEIVSSPAMKHSRNENSPRGRYHRALANVQNDIEVSSSKPVGGTRNSPLNFAGTNKSHNPAYTSVSGEKQSADRRAEFSAGIKFADTLNSACEAGIYNPAVHFAASNMIGNNNPGNSSLLDQMEKSEMPEIDENRGMNYATSETHLDQELARLSVADSTPRSFDFNGDTWNPMNDMNAEQQNRDLENSLLAEQILNEALMPPSSIHTADIIGSTLNEKGLSFIREKLTSKYSSAQEEPVNPQSCGSTRELRGNEGQENATRSKRADQLRRQGAFDKEVDRNDIIAAMRNPTGIMSKEFPRLNIANESLGNDKLCKAQNFGTDSFNQDESNYPGNATSGPCGKTISTFGALKGNAESEPRRQIIREICDNYLANPEQQSVTGIHSDDDNFVRDTSGSYMGNFGSDGQAATSCKSVRAELSNYGSGNSDVIRSEDLHNPVFPEEAAVRSGIIQNPVAVDRLRGEIEEFNMCQSKTQNCHQCRECIRAGDVVVTAEKANDAYWHPGCFVCSVCNELLADLVYFYYKGKLYCGRDLATLLEIPRCFACDELIFVREYTVAEGHNYHVKHFCCWDCDVPLAGQQYISENDRPLCLPCYQGTYAKTCRTCDGVIAADQQGVAVKNLNFHATDDCFCCATCKKSLLIGKMAIKADRPFCSKECITKFLNNQTS